MSESAPQVSLEVEQAYDVDSDAPLPDWTRLPGVASVGDPEPRALDARYYDTADATLATARTALRRRAGGPDEGWHIKRATPEGKHETRWPLDIEDAAPDGADPVPPGVVLDALAPLDLTGIRVIARIRNDRTAYALRDATGGLVAEVVDDHVRATDLGRGVQTDWREWELELGPAAPADEAARAALFAAALDLVASVGGRPAASASKLARALGF